jgi:hypothetical protein
MKLRAIDVVILLLLAGLYFVPLREQQDRTQTPPQHQARYKAIYVGDSGFAITLLDESDGSVYSWVAMAKSWTQRVSAVKPSEPVSSK